MRGVAEAKRGRGEYMAKNGLFGIIRTPPCPCGAPPLINEGGEDITSTARKTAIYLLSGKPFFLSQRARREPFFTVIFALFPVKWLLTPRGKPLDRVPSVRG